MLDQVVLMIPEILGLAYLANVRVVHGARVACRMKVSARERVRDSGDVHRECPRSSR